MNVKINITKKLIARLALVLAMVAVALILDVYLGNNPEELEKIQAEGQKQNHDQDQVYLITQSATTNVKTSVQKTSMRRLQVQLHDKFLRKYHSIRNYQVFKAEMVTQTSPLISLYHYLVYQNHFFSPDEDPLS